MAEGDSKDSELEAELHEVQHMVSRERLSLDEPGPDRTCFLSHVGAQPKLVPGPWIGHRDLVYAMALANLSQSQRTSLARAVLVEHGREFGVGRLTLEAVSSGLPLGGSSLRLAHRQGGGLRCLHTWALGVAPSPTPCDWLLLRAQPEWALDEPAPALRIKGLRTLTMLGGTVLVLVDTAVAALQIARILGEDVPVQAHPRFAPYLERVDPEARVLLWPHDAIEGPGLQRHTVVAAVLVSAPEPVRQQLEAWRQRQEKSAEPLRVSEAGCPGRVDRTHLAAFWEACGRPRVLLRGDSAWSAEGAAWLRGALGATVEVQGRATQLSLI
ncbi:hypothetical protein [Paraliomyxa miuraensis]|uniref:hypothetical protein n=1 Tax=Paraliomyxa miuraensis TaxID=376150 RepID=UPI00225A78CE|nr:hypothetical protein [Paraliomyxa miuraensis]MCX4242770.1 hypothetical protein [Paraliomyxa miuraensis]